MFSGCYEEDAELLSVEEIDSLHCLFIVRLFICTYKAWRRVTLPELDFPKEDLTGFSPEVEPDYTD